VARMKIQGQKKQRKTIFTRELKRKIMKFKIRIRNGSLTRRNLL